METSQAWLMPCHKPVVFYHDDWGNVLATSELTIEIPSTLAEVLDAIRRQPLTLTFGHCHFKLNHDIKNCEVHEWV